MKGYRRYFRNKLIWFLITLGIAFILNFTLPRMMPGDPVAAIVSRLAQGMTNATGVQAIYKQDTELFGTNKPILEQFIIYTGNVVHGNFGFSFSQYPRTVADVLAASIWWTIALQLPAICVGWIIGNTLGALAAYRKGGFDKVLLPVSNLISSFPVFGMAVILLLVFGLTLKLFPASGGYGFDMIPNFSLTFIGSVIVHYQLRFWSIVLVAIGGQAIGMRSMAIYELKKKPGRARRLLSLDSWFLEGRGTFASSVPARAVSG